MCSLLLLGVLQEADAVCACRRELVHTFRQRTLVLVKALILQKRVRLSPSFFLYPEDYGLMSVCS
jgi:hypothetical protein